MLRESFIYIASKALPSLIAFATGVALTWLMAPEDYGVYGLGTALVSLVSSAFFSWHAVAYMRYAQSGAENPRFMPTILQSFLLLCLVSGIGAAVLETTGLLGPDYRRLLWLCVPGTWCYAWFEIAARMQVARFRPVSYFWMNLCRNAGIMVLALTLAWLTGSPFYVLGGAFAAQLGAAFAFNSGGFDCRPRNFDRVVAGQLWTFGWPIAIVSLIAGSSFAIDRVLLEHFSGKAEVGFYTVAYSLAQTTIYTIGAGVDSAIYSRAVRAADRNDPVALQAQLAQNCTILLALMVPAAVGAAMVAPALARILVDPDYVEPVAGLIAWMAVAGLLLSFRANYVDHAFHFGHSTLPLTIVMIVMTAVNVVADLLLIPRYGAVGAAMASIIAGSVGMIHGTIAARRMVVLPYPPREITKVATATALMALFLWPLHGAQGTDIVARLGVAIPQTHALRVLIDLVVLGLQVVGGILIFGVTAVALDLLALRGRVARMLGRLRGA
jgi:O-antigen/teichoic acid export membrane protein